MELSFGKSIYRKLSGLEHSGISLQALLKTPRHRNLVLFIPESVFSLAARASERVSVIKNNFMIRESTKQS